MMLQLALGFVRHVPYVLVSVFDRCRLSLSIMCLRLTDAQDNELFRIMSCFA